MIKRYLEFITENLFSDNVNTKKKYNDKNLISEICICMVLINNEFLDPLLDGGHKSRYNQNSQVFVTDLKNLVLGKNRLKLGKFVDGKCIEDTEISKLNELFQDVDFDIEKDWNKLINSRIEARNIIDKLIPNDKLRSDQINTIYWLGPNKDKENSEDIVIELMDNTQHSLFLNKNLNLIKSSSFNTFADDLIGSDYDLLFSDQYIEMWNKLVQNWVKILYENANKNIQIHIEKYIEPDRIETLKYFDYFDLKNRDPKYQYLGEYIKEFDKNIKTLSSLLGEVWKNRESCFMDSERIYKEWMEIKIQLMNAKILEHLFTDSILKNNPNDVKKLKDGWKLANGNIKMKLVKTLVEKLGSLERDMYYLGNNGNIFYKVPKRQWFRDNYNDFEVKFDYHVKMVIDNGDEENNDFTVKTIISLNNQEILKCNIVVVYSGGEMSGKLSGKYKFELPDNFNSITSDNLEY